MSDYDFFSAMLRFVRRKTEGVADDSRTRMMMTILEETAAACAADGGFTVVPDRLEISARALAGFAAFLQKQILPEAVAHGNSLGERQIRWSIDTAMAAVNTLLARAALAEGQPVTITLPPPPSSDG